MKRTSILTLVLTAVVFGFAQSVPAQVPPAGERNAETAVWGSRTGRPIVPTGQPSSRHSAKLSPELQNQGANDAQVEVIVQFRHVATQAHHQRVRAKGGELKHTLDLVKGALYTLPASALGSLSNDDEVVYVTPNRQLQANDMITNVTVGANVAQNWGFDGSGMTVAVIDSGIEYGPDVPGGRVKYRQDWTNGNKRDDYGHGTHVAGIIGSTHHNYGGVAPKAGFLDLRVLDANGAGKDSDVISAIHTAVSLSAKYNVVAINLSLGRAVQESYKLDPLCQAVEAAWKAGIVVVVAAGNNGRYRATSGYGTINSPGNDPYVITVGAMKTEGTTTRGDDLMTTYSSKGPTLLDHIVKPDLVAPGNLIVSNMPTTATLYMMHPGNAVSPGYFNLSGTSMATPVVTAAAVLMLDQNGWLSPDLIKARLMKSATKTFPRSSVYTDPTTRITYTTQYDIFTVGAGYLDIMGALQNNDRAGGSALSPTAIYNTSTKQVKIVTSSSSGWGNSAVWGSSQAWSNSAVWGSSVLLAMDDGSGDGSGDGFSLIWGSSAVWAADDGSGDGSGDGFSLIWGSSAIYSANTVQSETSNVAIRGEQ